MEQGNHTKSRISGWMDRLTLRSQILISYSLMAAVVGGISIGLSLIMFAKLGDSVCSESATVLRAQTLAISEDIAGDIAATSSKQLEILGNSMSKVTARYSKILLTTTDPTRRTRVPPFKLLSTAPTYAEFNFTYGCAASGGCPKDFGPLSPRTPLPVIRGMENGSLLHTSTYLYSSARKAAVKDTSAWISEFASSQTLTDVSNTIAVQNSDLRVMYSNEGSMLSFLYLVAKVSNQSTGDYHSLFVTYPGVARNSSTYDPAVRPWFVGATDQIAHFYGPYVEPFSREHVVALSYKQSFPYMDHIIDIVCAAAVDTVHLRALVTSIPFSNNGYAIIYNKQTNIVLAWGNRTDLVDSVTRQFKSVQEMDSRLPAVLCEESTFEYTDAMGTVWLAGCSDALNASVSISARRSVTGNALGVIVFAQKSLVMEPLDALHRSINSTSSTLTITVLVLVLGLIFVVMLLVLMAVWNITSPLETMHRVALVVLDVMAEDEEVRDFTPLLNQAGFNVSRSNEVGVLACDFYHVMCLMHNKVVEKRATPKYPPNPWRMECEEEDAGRLWRLTWQDLRAVFASRPVQAPPAPAVRVEFALTTRATAITEDISIRGAPSVEEASTRGAKNSELSVATLIPSMKTSLRSSSKASNKTSSHRLRLTNKVAPLRNDELAPIAQARSVWWLTCLKTQLVTLGALLVLVLVGAMVATIVTLQRDSGVWSDVSADEMILKQMGNLESLVTMKGTFVEAYFAQMTMDIKTSVAMFTALLTGNLTSPTWETDGDYLHSYSADQANPYSLDPEGAIYYFSSYYAPADANCSGTTPHTCDLVRNATETRLTSLLDMKMESLLYPGSYLAFAQTAHEDTGLTRYWPMRYSSTLSAPTTCWVETDDIPLCVDLVQHSKCGNSLLQAFPPYDPRCREWYAEARKHPSASAPIFLPPRTTADGQVALTSVLSIVHPNTGARLGVMILNFLVSALTERFNKNPIMRQGYSYLVDEGDLDSVVIHPQRGSTCTGTRCAEGMTSAEYAVFRRDVLQAATAGIMVADSYMKRDKKWRVSTHLVHYGSTRYLLVGTVPDVEVVQFVTDAQATIDTLAQDMMVGFAVAIAVTVAGMAFVVAALVRRVMQPLDELRLVMRLALQRNYTKELPKHAGSVDMTALMHAVTQLLVALRLDSASCGGADIARTHAVFVDSVQLFTMTGNRKGLGASLSNLAALELAMGNSAAAKEHYERSIALGKEHVAMLEALNGDDVELGRGCPDELRRAKCVLSDRQGSLAAALLEQREVGAAISLLGQLLVEDKRNLHIRGCVTKQSLLGHMHLRLKELNKAEEVFTASLALVHELQESAAVRGSAMNEADAYEMLALCDLTEAAEARTWRTTLESLQALERRYLRALMVPAHMEVATARRVLRSLLALYGRHPQFAEAKRLVLTIADVHKLLLTADAVEGLSVARRVMLVLDYSSGMAGSRIRSLKDALHEFIKERLCGRDSVGILSFNNSVQEVLPLTVKADNAMFMAKRVESLVAPVGKRALYDGVLQALKLLGKAAAAGDWIVLLADGPDNKSLAGLEDVLLELAASHVSLVALGVGAEAPETALQRMAQASPRGFSVCLPATKVDTADLFGEVARLLQPTQVLLEDY